MKLMCSPLDIDFAPPQVRQIFSPAEFYFYCGILVKREIEWSKSKNRDEKIGILLENKLVAFHVKDFLSRCCVAATNKL
jgi:hypothetical protein